MHELFKFYGKISLTVDYIIMTRDATTQFTKGQTMQQILAHTCQTPEKTPHCGLHG